LETIGEIGNGQCQVEWSRLMTSRDPEMSRSLP